MAGPKAFGSTPHTSPIQPAIPGVPIVAIMGPTGGGAGIVDIAIAGSGGAGYDPLDPDTGVSLLVSAVQIGFALPDNPTPSRYDGIYQGQDAADAIATVSWGAQLNLARGTLFNAATWDRMRSASAANMALLSGLGAQLATGPGNWSVTHAPAANTVATITRAGVAGVSHICNSICGALSGAGAAATPNLTLTLRDGAAGVGAILWSAHHMAGVGFADEISLSGLNIVGTPGNAMTLEWSAAPGAGNFASVAMTGFDAS